VVGEIEVVAEAERKPHRDDNAREKRERTHQENALDEHRGYQPPDAVDDCGSLDAVEDGSVRSELSKQDENDNDDEDQPDDTDATVPEAIAVAAEAAAEATEQENDEEDNEDSSERHGLSTVPAPYWALFTSTNSKLSNILKRGWPSLSLADQDHKAGSLK